MNLRTKWQALSLKVAELSFRERLLILVVGLFLLFYLPYSLFLSSWWLETQTASNTLKSQQTQIKQTKELIELIAYQLQQDPNAPAQQERQQLAKNLTQLEQDLKAQTAELVSPGQMAGLLKSVLSHSSSLTLIELKSIAPKVLLELTAADEAEPSSTAHTTNTEPKITLYIHGVKLKLSGNYFAIFNYLLSLEQLPEKFYWKQLIYDVVEYPTAEMEVEIYTLSTNKEFIGG